MDASNLIKPELARWHIALHRRDRRSTNTASTSRKDAALARRFQPVFVGEPSVEDTIGILRGIVEKYELHHGVRITDGALVAAPATSIEPLHHRPVPAGQGD